jgi:hypothetical protein
MHTIAPTNTSVTTPANILLIEQDLFAYINTLARYISQEFYNIMIDIRASRRLTTGYRQYLAYKKISNIDIDTTQASAINI